MRDIFCTHKLCCEQSWCTGQAHRSASISAAISARSSGPASGGPAVVASAARSQAAREKMNQMAGSMSRAASAPSTASCAGTRAARDADAAAWRCLQDRGVFRHPWIHRLCTTTNQRPLRDFVWRGTQECPCASARRLRTPPTCVNFRGHCAPVGLGFPSKRTTERPCAPPRAQRPTPTRQVQDLSSSHKRPADRPVAHTRTVPPALSTQTPMCAGVDEYQ